MQDGLNKAFDSLDPTSLIHQSITRMGDKLVVQGIETDLGEVEGIYVVGAGKGALWLAEALIPMVRDKFRAGIINVPKGLVGGLVRETVKGLRVVGGNHPVPDEGSVQGAEEQLALLRQLGPKDLVLVVVTGGASSLLTLPQDTITLEDLQVLNNMLLKSGLDIHDINAVRKHVDRVKGGGLISATKANVIGLYVSDVLGNDLSFVGSGPTVVDQTTFSDCVHLLRSKEIWQEVPVSIRELLTRGEAGQVTETLKDYPSEQKVRNILLGSNHLPLEALKTTLEEGGVTTIVLTETFAGEASLLGEFLAHYCSYPYVGRPKALLAGGESVVALRTYFEPAPSGGRNQELVLAWLVEMLENTSNASNDVLLVSVGTDGIDGNSPHAGAIGIPAMWEGEDTLEKFRLALERHESSSVLGKALITTGPTKTNVADLLVLLLL